MMHPSQPQLPAQIEDVWLAAIANAEIDLANCLLYVMDGRQSDNGNGAWYVMPGFGVGSPGHVGWPPELAPLLGEINSEECIGEHRVFVWQERTLAGIAALIRHELEHALQLLHGEIGELLALTVDVLAVRLQGLPGGGRSYATIPAEADANSAAAMFVRFRYGPDRIDQLLRDGDEDASAFRSLVGPGPRETLVDRMICFLAAIRDLCEIHAERNDWPGQFEAPRMSGQPGSVTDGGGLSVGDEPATRRARRSYREASGRSEIKRSW